jgi:hypothetical protein
MRVVRLMLVVFVAFALVHCAADRATDERTAAQRAAVCVAEWEPTWRQGSGANEWWVEYEIGGAEVAAAYVEVPGLGTVTLSYRWNKWVGGSSFHIPRGQAITVHAETTEGLRAQTMPFAYLDVEEPSTDRCTPSGDCSGSFRPAFHEGSGANEWWVEYVITASEPVSRAYLELPSGETVPLAYEHQKWRGAPGERIPTGTLVVVHAESATGLVAETEPFPYLTEKQPALAPCEPGGGECAGWQPTWREGSGANEWWVEYVISGDVAAAYLEVPGAFTVPLAYEFQKWRGAPSTRIPSGTEVIVHAESTTGEVVRTETFPYLVEKTPSTTPCVAVPASYADIGGAETGPDVLEPSHVFFDGATDKILLVGTIAGRPSLRRCNADGTGCTAHLLDAGRGANSGALLAAVVDEVARKLLVVATDRAGVRTATEDAPALSLYRCDLDGTGCARTEIAGDLRTRALFTPAAAIDRVHDKLLVGTCLWPAEGESRAVVFRCETDGSGCTRRDISPSDAGEMCRPDVALVVDEAAEKLLFVALHGPLAEAKPRITRCDLDGTACTYHTLPEAYYSQYLSVAFDAQRKKLLVVASMPGYGGEGLAVVACDADGTGCARTEHPYGGVARPLVLDDELVLSVADGHGGGLFLLRCTPSGDACARTFLELDWFWGGPGLRVAPIAFDAARDTFLVGTSLSIDDGIPPYEVAPVLLRQPRGGGENTQHDVSAGPGESRYVGDRLTPDGAFVDEVNRKILALGFTRDVGLTPSRKIRRPLTRCELDGTGCTVVETGTAERILGVVDGHLYMLGIWRGDPREVPDPSVMELLRCEADGTACSRTEIQRPLSDHFTNAVQAALDLKHRMALVVAPPPDATPDLLLHRCPLDGSACLPPVALPPADNEALAVDPYREKLLVASALRQILRCDLDGTGCTEHDLSAGADGGSRHPTLLVDADGVYLVSGVEAGAPRWDLGGIALFACAPDLTGCARRDLALGSAPHAITSFSAALDRTANALVVATEDGYRRRVPTAYVCRRDGSGCREMDLSAGQPAGSGARPTVLVDHVDRRLHLVTKNEALLGRPSLFSTGL